MKILHLCPSNVATGGTDSIHRLVSALCDCGADAKILYVGKDLSNPQPQVYERYQCEYVTSIPQDFHGMIIFPDIWANQILASKYKGYDVAVNWQGVDVYRWNTPESNWYDFTKRTDALHFTNMQYGIDFLKGLGLSSLKVSDCVDDAFFEPFTEEPSRKNVVLYNPVHIKMTRFQETVMARATTELGILFTPIERLTQAQVIERFRKHKLYIDFGVFSGRERLPREAVTQGCCILTSKQGAAGYFEDNPIQDKYKLDDIETAISMIKYINNNYDSCKADFDFYRNSLKQDRMCYFTEVEELYHEIQHRHSGT